MIAVISDSHVPNRAPEIPKKIIEKIEEAELVIHCGDLATEKVYQELEQFNENLILVKGNCDFFDLPSSETFDRKGIIFGVYHGTGITPRGDHETLLDIARNKLEADILLHGHTHQEEILREDDALLLNPGSCTGVGGGSARPSKPTMIEIGIEDELEIKLLKLEEEEMKVERKESYPLQEFKNPKRE
ncbi:MAG: YfcE family phosphodiesterase [Nanohaloarchaea archaeon SW_7_43_1]|nr:MAG: YfcE family phosphodiesterase [Nanohaloarchaea archaeon SW_7_43_1]